MDAMSHLRNEIAVRAERLWDSGLTGEPHHPFGFKFLDWSIEVHPRMVVNEGDIPNVKLDCFKVAHTGQLIEICQVRL